MHLKASFLALLTITRVVLSNFQILPFLIQHKILLLSLSWCAFISILTYIIYRPRPILLLDYSCFKPDSQRRSSLEICYYFGSRTRQAPKTPEEVEIRDATEQFMNLIYRKSGLGDETYGPPYIFHSDLHNKFKYALVEVEEGMFESITSLLNKTGVESSKISHVVVGCSMFSPSPSLSTLIVNHFKLRESVKTYNLSGMGCSAGTTAFDLSSRLLRHEIGYVLIAVTESMGMNWYFGDERHMIVPNCIFRVGTAAALVTNDQSVRHRAKMELVRTLRTHHGADDASYNAAIQKEDKEGHVGVALTQDLIRVAGVSLKDHISTLAPHVLPISELLKYACNIVKSLVVRNKKFTEVPDFTTAFEHICIHSGGKAVINSISRIMKFDEEVVEPARMCLHRFGNTSSSLVFYELAYFEAKKRIKEGDRVWMLAFGTGFKACSVVWRALRDSRMDSDNPWTDCIHRYPLVTVTKERSLVN